MPRIATKLATLSISLVTLASVGCRDDPSPELVQGLDTAAVDRMYSDRPAWPDGAGWRVDSVPSVRIGVQDGPAGYQFFRLNDAIRLDDGTLIAANAGSGELRYYDPHGTFIRTVGGQGSGPGEFSELSSLRLCRAPDGRLLVDDGGNDRVHVFTATGAYEATLRLEPAGGRPPNIVGCLGDGRLIGIAFPGGSVLRGEPGEVLAGTSLDYVVVDRQGAVTSAITRVSGARRYVNEAGGRTHYPFIPFDPSPAVAAGQGHVYVLRGGAAAVEQWEPTGTAAALFAWPAPRTASESVWDRYVEDSLGHIGDDNQRRRYARFYDRDLPLPDSTPALQDLRVDADGTLWARRYRLPWEEQGVWDVIDAGGTWLGTVEMPDALTVFGISHDRVVGRHVDSLGVERLVVHELEKSRP